jgi:hypothetical protein
MQVPLWQIASGLGVGAFLAALFYFVIMQFGTKRGKGFQTAPLSATATAVIAVLIIVIFGGVTTFGLYLYAPLKTPPKPLTNSAEELQKLLGDRYPKMRQLLKEEEARSKDPKAFQPVREKVEAAIKRLEEALADQNMIRIHEATKEFERVIQSDEAKENFSPETLNEFHHVAGEPGWQEWLKRHNQNTDKISPPTILIQG